MISQRAYQIQKSANQESNQCDEFEDDRQNCPAPLKHITVLFVILKKQCLM